MTDVKSKDLEFKRDAETNDWHGVEKLAQQRNEALAEVERLCQTSAAPVAWRYKDARGHWRYTGNEPKPEHAILKAEPLYASRVGLSVETSSSGWQPISTAPTDGTEFIAFHKEAGVCACFRTRAASPWYCMDGWNTYTNADGSQRPRLTSFINPPECWMPMPKRPGSPEEPACHHLPGQAEWCSRCNPEKAARAVKVTEAEEPTKSRGPQWMGGPSYSGIPKVGDICVACQQPWRRAPSGEGVYHDCKPQEPPAECWTVADANRGDVRAELRAYANRFPLAGRALAEIERLRSVLVDVIASSDMQPCLHARIATAGLRTQVGKSDG
jgi:hypothetical protein